MAKRQSRRSISIKGVTYQRIKNWCERNEQSISSLLEELINKRMDDEGEPVPEKLDVPRPKPTVDVDEIISQNFTF